MKKKIVCVVQARVAGSQRIPEKMIRPFAGSSLIEIALRNLKRCRNISVDDIYLLACEEVLFDIARKVGIKIYHRPEASIREDFTFKDMYKYLWDIPADYFLQVSACNPMLKPETIDEALDVFQKNDYRSLFSVTERKNFFFSPSGELVSEFLGPPELVHTMNTKMIGSLYEAAHCIYIWSAERMKKEQKRWDFKKDDPFLFPISPEESFDIDYPWQFDLAELVYKKRIKAE